MKSHFVDKPVQMPIIIIIPIINIIISIVGDPVLRHTSSLHMQIQICKSLFLFL